ncbi:MAG TPA: hypothetical protein VGV63_01805 [Acidimicrobiales bacterium]|nr:hypothetical protein [Acidimicrobiales bacterium]
MDHYCTNRTIGETNRQRQLGAAAVLALGALACVGATLAGWPLYQTLIVLGGAATLAWLVDGSSQRFMGPGLAALAVGGGITAYQALGMDVGKGEHGVVYPVLGAALLLASLFNPLAIRGAGTFLLIVGVIALVDTPWSPGWTLAGILAMWSAFEVARISKGQDTQDEHAPASPQGSTVDATRTPVEAGARH